MIKDNNWNQVLIFTRTKHGANRLTQNLIKAKISAAAIHGNKSQVQRQKALGSFKNGRTRVLVATDIAARGIDVSELSLVINYDLPNVPETYVHRIGRTGRAKASGVAMSFCSIDERPLLRDIEKLIKTKVDVIEDHPFHGEVEEPAPPKAKKPNNRRGSRQGQGRGQGQSRSRGNANGGENRGGGGSGSGGGRSKRRRPHSKDRE